MCTIKWARPKFTQDWRKKKCTKLLSPDNFNFIPSAKWNIVPFMAPPINHQNTQNKRKLYYGFVQGPLQFQSTRQNPCTADLKNSNLAMLAFKKKLKLSKVSENSTHPLQNYACFFSLTSKPGSYVHKPTPCHWAQNGVKLHMFLLAQ